MTSVTPHHPLRLNARCQWVAQDSAQPACLGPVLEAKLANQVFQDAPLATPWWRRPSIAPAQRQTQCALFVAVPSSFVSFYRRSTTCTSCPLFFSGGGPSFRFPTSPAPPVPTYLFRPVALQGRFGGGATSSISFFGVLSFRLRLQYFRLCNILYQAMHVCCSSDRFGMKSAC
jgi:hypothetical protein